MSEHDPKPLFTGVLSVRAWGEDEFNALMAASAAKIVAGETPLFEGVTYESDPGSGGPYETVVLRKFQFRVDGYGLPGYPGSGPRPARDN